MDFVVNYISKYKVKPFYFIPINVIRDICSVYTVIDEALIIYRSVNWSQTNNFLIQKATRLFTRQFLRDERMEALGPLPSDVWGKIGQHLPSRLDIVRFRSVCKKLRSSLPAPARFPLALPPPPNCYLNLLDTPFAITEVDMYATGNSNRVHVALEEVAPCTNVFRPDFTFPKARVTNYPKECCMDSPPEPFNRLSFVTKAFYLRKFIPRSDDDGEGSLGQLKLAQTSFVKKTVLVNLSNPDDGVNPVYARMSDLGVVAYLSSRRLALLRLGGGGGVVWDTNFCDQVFVDIGTYKGRLCALNKCGIVYVMMDNTSLGMYQLGPPLSTKDSLDWLPSWGRVVETRGDLYVVDARPLLVRAKVAYKLSLRHHKWFKVRGHIKEQVAAIKAFYVSV